jgi:hypothetical protein
LFKFKIYLVCNIFSNLKFVQIIILFILKNHIIFFQICFYFSINVSIRNLFKLKICSKFEIRSYWKFVHIGICLDWKFVQNSNLKKFKIWKRSDLRKEKHKKLESISYWAGPCVELCRRALLLRANVRRIGPPDLGGVQIISALNLYPHPF